MNVQPIIIDVGFRTTKDLKKLKNNKGKLLEMVEQTVREHFPLSVPGRGRTPEKKLIPVVLVFEKKQKLRPTMLYDILRSLL